MILKSRKKKKYLIFFFNFVKLKNLKQGTTALRFATEAKPVSFYMIHNVLHEKKVTLVTKFLNLEVFLLVTVKFNPFSMH